jgi:hypothetical protein
VEFFPAAHHSSSALLQFHVSFPQKSSTRHTDLNGKPQASNLPSAQQACHRKVCKAEILGRSIHRATDFDLYETKADVVGFENQRFKKSERSAKLIATA